MKYRAILFAASLFVPLAWSYGQRDLSYDNVVVTQTRIDARDLGYPPVDVIPDGESGITSLSVAPNGDLYGATSGSHAHLFVLNPRHGYVQPLGVIPGAASITNAIVVSDSGDIFLGTSPGGHLFKYTPHDEYNQQIQIGKPLLVTDLGQAIPGESIFTLAIDRDANLIYGLTTPNTHFFQYSIATGKFTDLGVVSEETAGGERFQKDKMMSRMLVVDQQGMVFVSGENGAFFRFNPKMQKIEKLAVQVPAVPGREPWTRVDAFLLDPSGIIYGGTSDGYLFRPHPLSCSATSLGRRLHHYRIERRVGAESGTLYGVGGDPDEMAR